jgi:hypothetical protein
MALAKRPLVACTTRGRAGNAVDKDAYPDEDWEDIKNSPQYIASTQWGKKPSPGSHASQQEDPARAREESSGSERRRQ